MALSALIFLPAGLTVSLEMGWEARLTPGWSARLVVRQRGCRQGSLIR